MMSKSKVYREFFKGFAAGLLLGALIFVVYSADQFFVSEDGRNPAAINKSKIFDLSYLEGGALKTASAKQVLQQAQVIVDRNDIGISLGHFVAKSNEGDRKFLCEIYDNVELSFEAEGMAINGERPRLIVTGPCETDENLNKMKPIRVPFSEIQAQQAGDGEFSFGSVPEHFYRAYNIGSIWPDQWVLAEVRFTNKQNPSTFMLLDRRDVYTFSKSPIVLNWAKNR